ncbi:MAG: MarR family transcriptional regulator [Devosia sp.]|uniref:GbsR/MarR family transcriptional regulator n=1 Tax=unclassified Devosia TaxID=196773 RepID=UPI001A061B4B|nr:MULTISPECIES: MarR family transcriptional regulator [unclassified Devosia]MBF0680707.1 MarR family transcriptional regulator [Devosia sp.]WEJ32051.1 MarR family transcriptional regulator [Devosia sp. SD17-2]
MTTAAIDRFIEEMGLIAQQDGGPRIAGRIMGLLIAEGRELSLNQISERLRVSRASVSTNARQLAARGLVRLKTHSGDRQDYYELSSASYVQMLQEMAGRLEKYASVTEACAIEIESESEGAARRVTELSAFYRDSSQFLGNWATVLLQGKASLQDKKQ